MGIMGMDRTGSERTRFWVLRLLIPLQLLSVTFKRHGFVESLGRCGKSGDAWSPMSVIWRASVGSSMMRRFSAVDALRTLIIGRLRGGRAGDRGPSRWRLYLRGQNWDILSSLCESFHFSAPPGVGPDFPG